MKIGIVGCKMSFAPLDIVFVEQLLPQGSFPNQIQLAFLHIPVPCTLVIFWTTFEQHNVPLETNSSCHFHPHNLVIFVFVLLQPFWPAGSLSKTVLYDSYLIWRFALQLHKYSDIFLFLKLTYFKRFMFNKVFEAIYSFYTLSILSMNFLLHYFGQFLFI